MIRNSSFTSNTTSGTGNRALTIPELDSLIDNNVYTLGVQLVDTEVLYLDIDLGYKLKVDSILLYTNDLTKLANVTFYSKSAASDVFSVCSKTVSAVSYVGTVPNPSAPRYIRCVVSGTNMLLHELQVLNNDNIVAFGADGSLTDTFIEDTPEGVVGEVQAIDIYNDTSGDKPANAYVCVDYTGQQGDFYVDIAAESNGPFYNLSEGDIIKNSWSRGTHNNTKVSNTSDGAVLVLSKPTVYEHLSETYIGILPVVDSTFPKSPFGVVRCTAYDKVHKKLYVAFWPGITSKGSPINLWCYDVQLNTWTFRGALVSALWDTDTFSMGCSDTAVYFLGVISESGATRTILKHSMTGSLANLSVFKTFTITFTSTYYYFMVGDFKGNIWIKCHGVYQGDAARQLYKLNEATAALTPVSNNFFLSSLGANVNHLVYDDIRDRIYVLHAESIQNNNFYIEMYDVLTDTWYSSFFNFGNRIMAQNMDMAFCFYNDNLYFQSAQYNGKIYRYNLSTDELDTLPVNIPTKTGIVNKMVVLEPLDAHGDESVLILTGITDIHAVFGYNLPQTLNNSIANLTHITGNYTTPIFALPDANKASYLRIPVLSNIGTTNVSKYKDIQDGIIEVRSSDMSPLPVDHVFWLARANSYSTYFRVEYNNNTAATSFIPLTISNTSTVYTYGSAISRRTGYQLSISAHIAQSANSNVFIFNFGGELVVSKAFATNTAYFGTTDFCDFDVSGGFWSYDAVNKLLKHFNSACILISEVIVDGLCGLATDFNTNSVWYISNVTKALVHLNNLAETETVVNILEPLAVCADEDGGCWVVDHAELDNTKAIKNYSSSGELIVMIPITSSIKVISSDTVGGFYTLSFGVSQEVSHYDKYGNLTMNIKNFASDDKLSGGKFGVVVYSTLLKRMRYVSLATKAIVWTKFYTDYFTTSAYMETYTPRLFTFDIEFQQSDITLPKLIPRPEESLWATNSTLLPWKEVDKDGYFLTKSKYTQARVTLWNFDATSTPTVVGIYMAPAIQITDIQPQKSKPFFIRSNIPAGNITQLDTRIKVWWDIAETD